MGESDDKDVDISSTTPCQADPCYDCDGNYNEVLTRFVNGEFPDYDYYEKGALFKIPKNGSLSHKIWTFKKSFWVSFSRSIFS